MSLNEANQLISQNFGLLDTAAGIGGRDGLIGRVDLQAILGNPAAPPRLRQAAKMLLDNPAYFNRLDTAAGIGNVDGLIGRQDVDAYNREAHTISPIRPQVVYAPGAGPYQQAPAPGFDAAAAQQAVLQQMMAAQYGRGACTQQYGQFPGGFNPNVTPGYNPGFGPYGQLPGGFNPNITPAYNPYGVGGPGDVGALQGGGMSVRDACAVLNQNWDKVASGKHKTVDKASLEKLVASDSASPELKLAANTLLNNPQALGVISGAHNDKLPFLKGGSITKSDINTVLSPGNTSLNGVDPFGPPVADINSPQDAAAILKKHWDKVGTGKFKSADKGQLEKIVASDSAPPELKAACNAILRNPGWLERIGGSHGDGPFLGKDRISAGDLNTVLSPGWVG